MWVSPIPQEVLRRFNLVTKECQENKMSYQDLLITRKDIVCRKKMRALLEQSSVVLKKLISRYT